MKCSALALGHSLFRNAVFITGIMIAAVTNSSATANTAATASDSFRISPEDVKANETALGLSDPGFRALHDNWGRTTGAASKVEVAIPSINPVEAMRLSSVFGPRSAPTRGASRNHKGLDIPGPVGSPIYATADAIVGRAQWIRGYGKYVELEHGNLVETRYGHMSALNVTAGQRVKKGDIIGFMGSTGRSTGSHLHYEVRIGGEAVNPSSFLAPKRNNDAKELIASQQIDNTAIGGPAN
jgi:murein DD-endopeptidase MepM/ murein hydrolase activator NlpD